MTLSEAKAILDSLFVGRGQWCSLYLEDKTTLNVRFECTVAFTVLTVNKLVEAFGTTAISFEADPGHPDWSEWTGGEPGEFTMTIELTNGTFDP